MTSLSLDFDPPLPVDPIPQKRKTRKGSRKSFDGDRMAEYFRARPNVLVSALTLEDAYGLRWRTTVSDLRFPPYAMDVRNHQVPYVTRDGRHKRKSFYIYVPLSEATGD